MLFCSKSIIDVSVRIRNLTFKKETRHVHGIFKENVLWILLRSVEKYNGILSLICQEYYDFGDIELYNKKYERMNNIIKNNRKKFLSDESNVYKKIDDGYFINSKELSVLNDFPESKLLPELIKEILTVSTYTDSVSASETGIFVKKTTVPVKNTVVPKLQTETYNRNLLDADLSNYTPNLIAFEEKLKRFPQVESFLRTKECDVLETLIITKDPVIEELLAKIDTDFHKNLKELEDLTISMTKSLLFKDSVSNLVIFKQKFVRSHIKNVKVSTTTYQMNLWFQLLKRYYYIYIIVRDSDSASAAVDSASVAVDSDSTEAAADVGLRLLYKLYSNKEVISTYNTFIEHKQLLRGSEQADICKYAQVLRWIISVYKCFDMPCELYITKYDEANTFIPRQRARRELIRKHCFQKINIVQIIKDLNILKAEYLVKPLDDNRSMKLFQSCLKILFTCYTIGQRSHVFNKTRFVYFNGFRTIQSMIEYLTVNFNFSDNNIWKVNNNEKEVSLMAIQKVEGKIKGIVFITNASKGTDRATNIPEIIVIYRAEAEAHASARFIHFPKDVGLLVIRYLENFDKNFVTFEHDRYYNTEYTSDIIPIGGIHYESYKLFPNIYHDFNNTFECLISHKNTFLDNQYKLTLQKYRTITSNIATEIVSNYSFTTGFTSEDSSFIREYLIYTLRKSMKHSDQTYQKYYSMGKADNVILKIHSCIVNYMSNPTPLNNNTDVFDIFDEEKLDRSNDKKRKRTFDFEGEVGHQVVFKGKHKIFYLGIVEEIHDDYVVVKSDSLVHIDHSVTYYLINNNLIQLKRGGKKGIILSQKEKLYQILLLNEPSNYIYRKESDFNYL